MALFTWWHGDPLPALRALDGFHATASDDTQLLTVLAGLDPREVQHRLQTHHRPYIAYLGATPVAYGWVALEGADIGELHVQFTLPAGDRYLWDFKTLPDWRGRGIYPRLCRPSSKQRNAMPSASGSFTRQKTARRRPASRKPGFVPLVSSRSGVAVGWG